MLRELIQRFPYRLDTNFAKMNRILHSGIEDFKAKVLGTTQHGMTIQEWGWLLRKGTDLQIRQVLSDKFNITEEDTDRLLWQVFGTHSENRSDQSPRHMRLCSIVATRRSQKKAHQMAPR